MQETLAQLPDEFCWTRFGVHAGEPISDILERKERERQANSGIFLWGVGNSVRHAVAALISRTADPQVVFSPIKSRPRVVDVRPTRVVSWRVAELMDGRRQQLPAGLRVHSCAEPSSVSPSQYALVCFTDQPLRLTSHGLLRASLLRNLLSGTRIGASQVTAVVSLADDPQGTMPDYDVSLRARLVPPYFVRLLEPEDLR